MEYFLGTILLIVFLLGGGLIVFLVDLYLNKLIKKKRKDNKVDEDKNNVEKK